MGIKVVVVAEVSEAEEGLIIWVEGVSELV